ncbi:MAG: YbhB/YbcL family Raf kinase inhibitor-like protein [Ignavibacteria bacterium]|nr:YbhB/YbcL family Raf kinase inhibitor-like protein [Ignavibacteria bacterium]MBI3766331.1 YbhB/YbcL family Raf kinase inhibitor-like protein [Ignavibacteriales bacterium]
MRIVSSAFQDGKPIPTKYAHPGVTGGQNISLPLSWSDAPPTTQSFALSIVDPHPVAKNWVHWFVINLPPKTTGLSEGASGQRMPAGSKELYNTYGTVGYGGPEPPKGSGPHPYEVTLYALNVGLLDLPENTSLATFKKALEGKVIASAKVTGIYER